MKLRAPALLTLAAVLAVLSARAHAADLTHVLVGYTITSWSTRTGLPSRNGWVPSTYIWTLAQDREGYVWLGTDSGLVRFDGEHFLQADLLSAPPLPSDPVRALCVARDGSLWIGFGAKGGVSRIRNGQTQNYGDSAGTAPAVTTALVEDRTGAIWAASNRGLYRFAADRWEKVSGTRGVSDGPAGAAFVDHQGNLFVATSTAILRLDAGRNRFDEIESVDAPVNAIVEDGSGSIWVADPVTGARQLGKPQDSAHVLEGGSGNQLLSDRKGNLWVGTAGQGLWRVRREPAGDVFKIERATTLTGLLTDGVLSLLEDREGNIWAGTTEGLNRLTPYKLTPINLGLTQGVEVAGDGTVWVGTVNGLIEFPDGRADGQRPLRLPGSRVTAIHADQSGILWVATNSGLLRVGSGRTARVLPRGYEPPRDIASITSDAHGLWMYDLKRGLLRLNKSGIEAIPLPWSADSAAIVSTFGDKSGRLWIGLSDGQVAIVGPNGAVRLCGPDDGLTAGMYQAIYETTDGVIWLGGSTGLSRYLDGGFATIPRGKDFPAESITAIVEDGARALWLGTSNGIVRLENGEFARAVADHSYKPQYALYGRSDGLGGMPVTTGVNRRAVRAADGRLWFVTRRGITLIDPATLGNDRGAAPVHIESITADGQPLRAVPGARLTPRTTRLAIDYGVLNLTSQVKTRFRYQLEGFDSAWTEAGWQRQAVYTNLPPGRYQFRVMATTEGGSWTDPPATWDFFVNPMFYQTAWFLGVCATATVLTLWGTWRFHLRRVRREFSLLLRERARLSRELHDTLLQSLVGVALQCDAIAADLASPAAVSRERFTRMRKQVEEHIREARQSICDLRSPRMESRDLAAALRDVAEHAAAGHDVAFEFSVSGTQRPCAANVEEHLLRIGQEAVVNAIRHAQAGQVRVELQYEPAVVALRVRDDGRGFDPERCAREPNGHYGLTTMKERAADIGATFTIASGIARGTEIQAIVPTAPQL